MAHPRVGALQEWGACRSSWHATKTLAGKQASPVDVARVFTHRVSLADGPAVSAAYDMFERRRDGCIKVALLPGGPAEATCQHL